MNVNYAFSIVAGQQRWRWDLNPRRGCPLTRFRGVRPRPLGDSTAAEPTRLAPGRPQAGRMAGSARAGPALREELAQQSPALLRKDSAHYLGAVVEPAVAQDVPERARRTRLRVGRPVNDAPDPGRYHGPGAHGARLERDHQRATIQMPGAESAPRRPDGDDFGMRGGVGVGLPPVVSARYQRAGRIENDRPDGHLRMRCGGTGRFLQRRPHRRLECRAETGGHAVRLPPARRGYRPSASSRARSRAWPNPSLRAMMASASSGKRSRSPASIPKSISSMPRPAKIDRSPTGST